MPFEMIPVDALMAPLKIIRKQLNMSLQRAKAIDIKRKKGTLQETEVCMVEQLLKSEGAAREKLYDSLEKVVEIIERFKQLPDSQKTDETKLISRIGNTPVHRENQLSIIQSDELNQLIRNVCVTEFAARKFADPVILQNALKETGLDYSATFAPLHSALADLRSNNKIAKLRFLAKELFAQDQPSLYQQFELMAKSLGSQVEDSEDDDVLEVLMNAKEDPTEIQKKINDFVAGNQQQNLSKVEQLCQFVSEKYIETFYVSPYYPERLIAHGYEVFTTQLCNPQEPAFCQFDGYYCACPGCFRPDEIKFTQSKDLQTVLRCYVTKKIIDLDNNYYFMPEKGFLSEEGKSQLIQADVTKAIKVNLVW